MANEYTLGQKISSIGAMLGGTVPQFQQQMEQLDEKRMEALYKDAGAAYALFQTNNFSGIVDLANDRLGLLQRLPGSNPEDTMQVLQLAQAAQNDPNARTQLGQILEAANIEGIRRGYFAAPAAPERITVKPGDSIFERGPEGWESVASVPTPLEPVEYRTFTNANGIDIYAEGPYAGLSVGKVAELLRTGQIAKFGQTINVIPPTQINVAPPLQTVLPVDSGSPPTRQGIYEAAINGQQLTAQAPIGQPPIGQPPIVQTPPPDYSNLSTQEAAIRRREDAQQQIERSRATAAEDRNAAAEARAVAAAEAIVSEAETMQDRIIFEANQMYDVANRLLSSDTSNITGFGEGSGWAPKFTARSQQQVSDFDALTDLLTLGNMGRMTGVLSETDIKILSDAATLGINRRAGDKQFQNSLRRIVGAISRLSEAQNFKLSPVTYDRDYYSDVEARLEIPINQQGILTPQTQDQINLIYVGEQYAVINPEGVEEVKTKTLQDRQAPGAFDEQYRILIDRQLINVREALTIPD